MACLASFFSSDRAPTRCNQPERVSGAGLCVVHDLFGTQPRLPPRVNPQTGRLFEEDTFFVPRACIVGTHRDDLEFTRCHKKMTGDKRCCNETMLWPYCPAHTLTELNLLVDLQYIRPGDFQLGLYVFDAMVGRDAPVFFSKSEVVSMGFFTVYQDNPLMKIVRRGGGTCLAFYASCGRPLSKPQENAIYGATGTAPNGFTAKLGPTQQTFDCTWRRGLITMANTTERPGCNAVFVSCPLDQGVVTVAIEATNSIRQGCAVMVNYGDEYDFARIPRVSYEPRLPDVPVEGTLYDFRRTASPNLAPLRQAKWTPPVSTPDGMVIVQQTSVIDVSGMLDYFGSYTVKVSQLVNLPGMGECQDFVHQLIGRVSASGISLRYMVDAVLEYRGRVFINVMHMIAAELGVVRLVTCDDDASTENVLREPSVFADRDLVLVTLCFVVSQMAEDDLDYAWAKRATLEHVYSFLRGVAPSPTRVWSERDGVFARAYVTASQQLRPWMRPPQALAPPVAFDQLMTTSGTIINLPAAFFCPNAESLAAVRLKMFRNEFASTADTAMHPLRLQRVHFSVLERLRKATRDTWDFMVTAVANGLVEQELAAENVAGNLRSLLASHSHDPGSAPTPKMIELDCVNDIVTMLTKALI